MTLSDLASIGSFVSAVAVVISLVYLEGLLSTQAFASFVASVKGWTARAPGIRAAWRQFRGLFVSEFAEWMDRTLAEVAPAPPIDSFAQWRALVAEERGAETGAGR
jgi:hypothetical protein